MIAAYPLDEIWPVVSTKIARICDRYAKFVDWDLTTVYSALENQRAILFNCTEDDSFAVTKIKYRNGEKILFIWIAYGKNGKRERNLVFLKEIARCVGATKLEMESPRKGFERMPEWTPCMTTFQTGV
jgi:hypothetical protein